MDAAGDAVVVRVERIVGKREPRQKGAEKQQPFWVGVVKKRRGRRLSDRAGMRKGGSSV